ncbi:hypothetical protein BD309DRAFT_966810 [Dichomitus squalens]|nr:hypothetical protein BD309DRAFT_966810 [Dichomitus squalens]
MSLHPCHNGLTISSAATSPGLIGSSFLLLCCAPFPNGHHLGLRCSLSLIFGILRYVSSSQVSHCSSGRSCSTISNAT